MIRFKGLKTILAMAVIMVLSACSQTRTGLGGRYEDVYLLNPVSLCSNGGGELRGCFDLQLNMTDNFAYLDVVDVTQDVANHPMRIMARTADSNGFDVLAESVTLTPGQSIQIAPLNGRRIYEYTEWYIESSVVQNTGVGLVPRAAPAGQGTPVVYASVFFSDLEEAFEAMGIAYY